jgi:hypothetical protein
MNVLVIPEDFRKDEFILKPIISAMLTAVGRPRAKVRVCKDPLLGGISQALDGENIRNIITRYRGMVQLFLLCVDRDGEEGRRTRLNQLEKMAGELLAGDRIFFAENAWQEVEVWVLAGIDLPADWSWAEIREERDPKERYFKPIAASKRVLEEPGEGRKTLAEEAAGRYNRIRRLCPEDIGQLEQRIQVWLGERS